MDQRPQHDTRFTASNRKTILNLLAKKILSRTPIGQAIRRTMNILDLINLKSFCTANDITVSTIKWEILLTIIHPVKV